METKLLIVFALCSFMLTGCGKSAGINFEPEDSANIKLMASTEEEEEALPATIVAKDVDIELSRKVEILDDLTNFYEYKENLNKHTIKAKINNQDNVKARLICWLIQFGRSEASSVDFIKKKSNQLVYEAIMDISFIGPTRNNLYRCDVVDHNEINIIQKDILLKRDILVKTSARDNDEVSLEHVGLSEGNWNLGALVLEDGVRLITNGVMLAITTDEFISQRGASIDTYSMQKIESNDNSSGKSGGSILIRSKKSLGDISINLRGMNAGKMTILENSYSEFKIPAACEYGTYTRTYNFPLKGKSGYSGGDSGTFELRSHNQLMQVDVNKIPGLGSLGQVSLNPTNKIVIDYTAVDDQMGFFFELANGTVITSRPNAVRMTGTVCNSIFKHSGKRGSVFYKYTIYNLTKEIPLSEKDANHSQRGADGQRGQEQTSCISDLTNEYKECF